MLLEYTGYVLAHFFIPFPVLQTGLRNQEIWRFLFRHFFLIPVSDVPSMAFCPFYGPLYSLWPYAPFTALCPLYGPLPSIQPSVFFTVVYQAKHQNYSWFLLSFHYFLVPGTVFRIWFRRPQMNTVYVSITYFISCCNTRTGKLKSTLKNICRRLLNNAKFSL